MQKRAGLLFLAKSTNRILLVLEDQKWTVPTFQRSADLLSDATPLVQSYYGKPSRIIPIELYLSEDKGFEYGTYICLVDEEFTTMHTNTLAWCHLEFLPKQLHNGLKTTLNNSLIRTKIETILQLQS